MEKYGTSEVYEDQEGQKIEVPKHEVKKEIHPAWRRLKNEETKIAEEIKNVD